MTTTTTPIPKTNVSARQVADRLGISVGSVYRLMDTGEIRSVRIGKMMRRTCWEWVQAHLDASQVTPETELARYVERVATVKFVRADAA